MSELDDQIRLIAANKKNGRMPLIRKPPKLIKAPKLSVAFLLRNTPLPDRNNSRGIGVSVIKGGYRLPKRFAEGIRLKFQTRDRNSGHKHWVDVISADSPIKRRSKVIVNCDCARFVYKWEVANAWKGASLIARSNGDWPIVTNPSLLPGLCKHAYTVLRYVYSKNGKTIKPAHK